MAETYETKKINELNEATSAEDSDLMMVGNPSSGQTSKITKENLMKDINESVEKNTEDIKDINSALAEFPQIQFGEIQVDANSIPANSTATVATITFPTAFKSAPRIFFALAAVSNVNYGSIQISAVNRTTTSFDVQVHNASSISTFSPTISWLAIA